MDLADTSLELLPLKTGIVNALTVEQRGKPAVPARTAASVCKEFPDTDCREHLSTVFGGVGVD